MRRRRFLGLLSRLALASAVMPRARAAEAPAMVFADMHTHVGMSEADIAAVLGGNYMRVLRQALAAAA